MPPSKKRQDKAVTEEIKSEQLMTAKPEPGTGFIDKNLGEYRGNGMWVKRN